MRLKAFYQMMAMRKFTPKLKQLEDANIEFAENETGETKIIKLDSKRRVINNNDNSRPKKFAEFIAKGKDESAGGMGFVPHMVNKNKLSQDQETTDIDKKQMKLGQNTIANMFKNAPPKAPVPPGGGLKRTIH